jgi:hypothetical protein
MQKNANILVLFLTRSDSVTLKMIYKYLNASYLENHDCSDW